jgi:tRNA threonylcarbamoyladenosine biosynthesis protein TsaE
VYHIDLYRLEEADEALSFGLEDYLYGDGLTLIEWADRAAALLPPAYLGIELYHMEFNKRRVVLRPHGARFTQLIADYRKATFGM